MSEPDPADGLPPLREVISRYGLRAKRSLGQNFLLDLNLTGRIARAAGDLSKTNVIEIGPGPGGLTRALLEAGAKHVLAIERDKRAVEALADLTRAYPGRLEIIEGNALHTDLATLVPAPRRVVSNLPYNIATPLLIGWLKTIGDYSGLTLMFQKEVAERIVAKPGCKAYGRLSVICQWLCQPCREFNVDKRAFTPPPKVTSSVVSFWPRPAPLAPATWDALETVTARAFGQRRKMIRSSLKSLNLDLDALGIDPRLRAENLSVEQFCALARAVAEQAKTRPALERL